MYYKGFITDMFNNNGFVNVCVVHYIDKTGEDRGLDVLNAVPDGAYTSRAIMFDDPDTFMQCGCYVSYWHFNPTYLFNAIVEANKSWRCRVDNFNPDNVTLEWHRVPAHLLTAVEKHLPIAFGDDRLDDRVALMTIPQMALAINFTEDLDRVEDIAQYLYDNGEISQNPATIRNIEDWDVTWEEVQKWANSNMVIN